MIIKQIVDEVFQDYKKPAMMISSCLCDWKCLKEQSLDFSICQNSKLALQKDILLSNKTIIDRYISNPITQAIVIAGLEPFLQFEEIIEFISQFREVCNDDIVIYTGYYPNEIEKEINILKQYKNIIIKFGRFKTDSNKKFDKILGVELVSDNQFAEKIS